MSESNTRDPFRIIDEARTAAELNELLGLSIELTYDEAIAQLGLETPDDDKAESQKSELLMGQDRFCLESRGVGVFSGSARERRFWSFALRKYSSVIEQDEGNCTVSSLTAVQAYNPSILMPVGTEEYIKDMREAGFSMRTGASDLAKAVELLTKQTRIDEEENITFIVSMPEIPEHVVPLMEFDAALTAGNESATALQAEAKSTLEAYFETNTEVGRKHVEKLYRRLDVYLDEIISCEAPEDIPAVLRDRGSQTSPHLTQGLEYLYYKRLLSFVDAGSGYRLVPEKVRIGLIVDETVYDSMLARGLSSPYATVQLWGPEASLGCYATIPRNNNNREAVGEKIHKLRDRAWPQDYVTPAVTAALLFADAELPQLPTEKFR